MSRECTAPGCGRPRRSRGYCSGHYQQVAKGRELAPLRKRSLSAHERFWQKVNRGSESECWMWTGSVDERGYGSMWESGRPRKAHRIAYEVAAGPIPGGMVIDHKCHAPSCVNPSHLQAVTLRENNENRKTYSSRSNSGIRGVSWHKGKRKWGAYTSAGGTMYHVGYFDNRDVALESVIAMRNEVHTNNLQDRRA